MVMSHKFLIIILLFGVAILFQDVSGAGYHIPTVKEGLLDEIGCYIGAYLGGNQGANNNMCLNYYKSASDYPYETQILDHPQQYGEIKSDNYSEMLKSIDTGIDSFRSGIESIKNGAGKKQLLFSRYFNLNYYPDNDYGKIKYTESPPPDVWAEKVLQQGGIPVLVLYPWALQKNGILDISAKNSNNIDGNSIIKEIAQRCDALSQKYADSQGKPATVLICFGLEYNTQDIVNPGKNDLTDNANKRAWRQMFRDAYLIVHANANPSVQMVWAGNVAKTKGDRIYYWPGTDDSGNQLSEDYVDWVGMTWYPWNNGPKTLDDLSDFYNYYARDRKHPMIFMETSADGDGIPADELSLKNNQVKYLYNENNLKKYPNVKGIIWFNVVKGENNVNQQLVTKNFMFPDANWENHGKSTTQPGSVYSASDHTHMMNELYPDAVSEPYFIGPSSLALFANFSAVIGESNMTVVCIDTSTGPGIISWSWDVDGDQKPDYYRQNITHHYQNSGTYPITLTISDGTQVRSCTYTYTIPPTIGKKSYISIGSLPGGADIWLDDRDKIGHTITSAIPYLVPSGRHTITLKKNGYQQWKVVYALTWPQHQYFGVVRLQKMFASTDENQVEGETPELWE